MADEVRLIDANALKDSLKKLKAKGYNQKYVQGLQDAIDGYFPQIIDDMPTVDVEPVKHGRWIKHRIDDPKSIPSARMYGDKDNNVRNLTDEETAIYESWIESEAKDTDLNIMEGDSDDQP